MAETTLLVYVPLAVIGFSLLIGAVGGYWIRAAEERLRTPSPEARRGRHARQEATPDE